MKREGAVYGQIGIIVFLVMGFGDNIVEGINTAYAGGSLPPRGGDSRFGAGG